MKRLLWIPVLALVLASPGLAEKRAFTLSDLYRVRGVADPRISPDGRAALFVRSEMDLPRAKRRANVAIVDLATGETRLLTRGGAIDAFDLSPDGRSAVVSRRTVGEPSELWTVELPSGAAKLLTRENAELEKAVDIGPAQRMTVPGADGHPVQVFLVKPHDFDPARTYPLILNVHGGPQSPWEDAFRGDWQVYPGAGYAVAFPNPHGSTGFGQAYTAAISGDWGGKVRRFQQRLRRIQRSLTESTDSQT